MSFTIATNNVPHYAPREKVIQHIEGPFSHSPERGVPAPSIINLQEFMKNTGLFKLHMHPAWRIQSVFGPQPMAYDSRVWRLKDMDGILVYDDTFVGKPGAGPATLTERYVQWLSLVHLETNFHLHSFNLHAAPSIYVEEPPNAEASRDELHEMLMKANAEKIDSVGSPCILTGDFNARWAHPNLNPLREVGLQLANEKGVPTHGRSQIDLITFRGGKPSNKRAGLKLRKVGRLPKVLVKDHWGEWAEFDFVKPSR